MNNKKSKSIDKKLFSVKSAANIDRKSLLEFYKKAYPKRYKKLVKDVSSEKGIDFIDQKTPLVVIYQNQVIAHAGTILFNVLVNGRIYTATWLIDIKVLEEYRRMGIASLIETEFMKISEISVGIGYSKPAFFLHKKLGWRLGHNYNIVYYPLRLLDMPFVRRKHSLLRNKKLSDLLNKIQGFFMRLIYKQNTLPLSSIKLLRADKYNMKKYFSVDLDDMNEGDVLRDDDYYKWRVLESPDNSNYRIFNIGKEEVSLLIKFNFSNFQRNIDILYISDNKKIKEVTSIISSLLLWALENNFSFVRQLIPVGSMLDHIKRKLLPIFKNPGFVVYSKNRDLLNKLEKIRWNWQGLDSDFEKENER